MTRLLLVALLAALVLPPSAAGQAFVIGTDAVGFPGGDAERVIPLRGAGDVVVDWESDPAACADVGRCGLDGVSTWRVPPTGDVRIFDDEGHGPAATLSLGDFFELAGAAAAAHVRRGPHLCADAAGVGAYESLDAAGGRLGFALGDLLAGAFATRCAGPVLDDLAGALPAVAVPASRLRRGRMTVDLAGAGTFAAQGLRGTVRSTVSLRLGAPRREGGHGRRPRLRTERVRYLSNRFRVAEVRGEVALDLRGADAAAECAPLDTCGLAGSLRVVPRATAGSLELFARAPARLGRSAPRTAVGLRPGRVDPRVRVFGSGYWAGSGLLVASIGRADDAVPCRDSVLLREGLLVLEPRGTRVRASLYAGYAGISSNGSGGRTRCPGPLLGGLAALAEADLPLTAFAARKVEIPLTTPVALADDGWSIAPSPAVTVVLERRAPFEVVRREPRF